MSSSAQKLVEDLGSLPPIPHIADQVLRLTSDPECPVSELQKLISSDQALAAQILKIANSTMFGAMKEIRTLPQAIVALGLKNLKSAVIASIAKDLYMKSAMGFYKVIIWEHSLVAALAGGAIAKILRFPQQDEVFLGGLLHDIGKSVLDMKYPAQYEKITKAYYAGEMPECSSAELEAFGCDHAMVAEELLQSWNIPPVIAHCVRWHHSPGNADPESVVLASYVSLGNIFALEMGKGIKKPHSFNAPKKTALDLAGIQEEALAEQAEAVFECIEKDIALITGF
ncbi:MAG: HDOD domain-containing protein [Holophagales bacterium]|jgi:HD-like signal output (HDOD) protein|nr:HDOD domain-containing protein [Holophagales bacterium]